MAGSVHDDRILSSGSHSPIWSSNRMIKKMKSNGANIRTKVGRENNPCALQYQFLYPSYEQRRGFAVLSKSKVKYLASDARLMMVRVKG